MDLTKLTDIEIKALIYDEMAKIEQTQNNIKILNLELQKRHNAPKEDVVKPE